MLSGMSLVILPLVFALYFSIHNLDRLANEGQDAVHAAVRVTQDSRVLAELTLSMERMARQYTILGEASLFRSYSNVREDFGRALQRLRGHAAGAAKDEILDEIAHAEQSVYDRLRLTPDPTLVRPEVEASFAHLEKLAGGILEESNHRIEREVDRMQRMADKATRSLLWQVLLMVPLAVLFVIGFSILLSRLFKQFNTAIRRLGNGDLRTPVRVRGPRDLQDLGERMDWLRRRLLDLEEQKVKFLRHVSHSLKTPLTAVREGSELLAEGAAGSLTPAQQEIAEILIQNSAQLQRLIEDLLNFNAAQHANQALHFAPVDLKAVCKRVRADQKLALQAKDLQCLIRGEDVEAEADAHKIETVFDNLLSNAIKFSPRGGKIWIDLRAESDFAVLDVRDEGPGVAPGDLPYVFEPYYQGLTPQAGGVRGSGLGLSIVREFILGHHGSVEVVQGTQGGAHFRALLPLKQGKTLHENPNLSTTLTVN